MTAQENRCSPDVESAECAGLARKAYLGLAQHLEQLLHGEERYVGRCLGMQTRTWTRTRSLHHIQIHSNPHTKL